MIDELQLLGRPFGYQPPVFVPQEFGTGLRKLSYAAAQAGVEAFRRGQYERAEGLYYLGYRGLWAESEYEEAVRAELYRFEALFAMERYAEAAECLEGVREFASLHLPIPYLDRQAAFLCWRAQHGDPANWPTEARALAAFAASVAQQSPPDSNRAMLIGAINVALLKQADLARELMRGVNVSALSDDDTELLARARSLIGDAVDSVGESPNP